MISGFLIKKYLTGPLLTLLVLVVFSLLINFPGGIIYTSLNLITLFVLSVFSVIYFLDALKSGKISKLFVLLLVFLFVPLIGSIQAKIYYNQPIIYGLLAERVKLFAFAGLLVVFLLEKKKIHLDHIEKIVITTAFVVFVILLGLNLFISPSSLENYDFVVKSSSKGFRFKLNHSLIVILYFYSLVKFLGEKKIKHLILALLILFYLIFLYKARSLTFSIFLASMLYFLVKYKLYKIISWGLVIFSILVVSASIGFVLFPDKLQQIFELFTSAFNVFLGGEVTDSSALSRISQFQIAKNGILKHPILGNGFLSSQWENGWEGMYGHFYPSDIGWMGTLFLYGFVGTLIYCVPFFLSWNYAFKLSKMDNINENDFVTALHYTLIYFFIHSATAGFFVKKLGIIVFIFSLVYFHYQSVTHNKRLSLSQELN